MLKFNLKCIYIYKHLKKQITKILKLIGVK